MAIYYVETIIKENDITDENLLTFINFTEPL